MLVSVQIKKDSKSCTLVGDTLNEDADSYLTCLTDPAGISGTAMTNITGNGHTVYYDQNACSALGGQTYTLNGGG